ncbi:MAG: type II secretion system protein N [Sphingobium sp.]
MHWPRLLELALVLILMLQAVRLFWAVATPVGPLGDWRGRQANIPGAAERAALFRSFDPFYPAAASSAPGTQNVTSLALTLFGVRINEGSGLGSAILADGDGVQNSYAVGDEIMPGVLLKAVLFDHVVIDRNGAEESVFLDQSSTVQPPAQPVQDGGAEEGSENSAGRAAAPGAPPEKPLPGRLTVDALKAGVGFGPRMSNGRITGIVLTQKGPGFAAAGFRPGDIVTQINGRPIGSADDLPGLQQAFTPGARVSLMVERGAEVVPIAILVQGQ